MATISSAGVGSGLDVRGLVEQLVAAEGNPVRTRLDRKEADLQEGLTSMASFRGALGEFKTSLENLRDSEQLRVIEVITTDVDEDFLSITSNNQAIPTEFNIDVLQLAKSHKLTTTKFQSDAVAVGSGAITFQFGSYNARNEFVLNSDSTVQSVKIEPESNNLRGISEAINNAKIGVKAIVINDGDSARLIFSSLVTGENNNLRITVNDSDNSDTDLNGLSTLAYDATAALGAGKNVHETQVAQDSKINIDGIEISNQSNTISNVIRGITFDVHSLTNSSINVQLELNNQAVSEFISGFVSSYNELMTVVDDLTGYDPETQKAGPLSGDASIRSIIEQLRRNLSNSFSNVNEKFNSLASIGIDTERNGKLKLNQGKLDAAIESELPEVVRLFSKTGLSRDPLIEFISATNQTEAGSHEINISQLATKAVLLGQTINTPKLLIDNNNNEYVFRIDGVTSNKILLTEKIYSSVDVLATELQTRINTDDKIATEGLSVSVSNNAGRLEIISNRFGSGSRVELVKADVNSSVLGLSAEKGIDGIDVAGTISKVEANGTGQVLTGTKNVEGLAIKVQAGNIGKRKEVIFSRGIAEQLDLLINKMTDSDGLLNTRNDGFNSRLEDITQQRQVLDRRLVKLEQRLMKQFTALDSSLGRMQKTSEFLSNQLSGLPGARNPNKR
jgi:flagellar hook-associated protein 2